MIRRHAIAVLAMVAIGLVVAAPAQAGGTAGAVGVKKTANVVIKNNTTSAYYVLVVPTSLATSTKFGTPDTVGWAKNLGAYLLNPGKSVTYPVPAGPGEITIYDPVDISIVSSAPLPASEDDAAYTVNKGKSVKKTIAAGPVIQ